ncbi:MAG: hypothetical protein ACYTFO_02500, partial [Planctomycetota bacterium]
MPENAIPPKDRDILRRLLARKIEIADDPVNCERREAWYKFDACDADARPIIMAEVGGVMGEVFTTNDDLECESDAARGMERGLRMEIWDFEELQEDRVVEPWLTVGWNVSGTDYGVQQVVHNADTSDGRLGARNWEAPIKDINADFDKLHIRQWSVDREATAAAVAAK